MSSQMVAESTVEPITVMFAISGFFGIALLVSAFITIKGNRYTKTTKRIVRDY
ncbi:MAG TPA: hypothetical protein VFY68_02695 [Nitrososphaeraceae archaeon]|nr:hypothetical protein [Nitrososphaeraceae archaeon]